MAAFKPELMYFNIPGRAEVSRLAFHYGGVDFTDNRIEGGAKWAAAKSDVGMFGKLPVLAISPNDSIAQSIAIAQYAYEKAMEKLGKLSEITPEQRAQDLMVVSTLSDLLTGAGGIVFADDAASKEKAQKKFDVLSGELLGGLENMVDAVDKYFSDNKELTLADIAIYDIVTNPFFQRVNVNYESYPKLQKIAEKVASNANIAAYVAKREA